MTPQTLLAHLDSGQPWPDGMRPLGTPDLAAAYQLQLAVRALRLARGEQPRGFKVGFTNRGLWERYGVFAPIWGTVWDTTLSLCEGSGEVSLARNCQPRIEPEAVLGIARSPGEDLSPDALYACLDWVAPGFEIVQSHCPGWKFGAADTVADSALHAHLLVGRRVPVATLAGSGQALEARLATCELTLSRQGVGVEAGLGRNVLDGPLHALAHFIRELRACPGAPALLPGDVVTTGTWTDAWPVAPGERWQADFGDLLGRLEVHFKTLLQ